MPAILINPPDISSQAKNLLQNDKFSATIMYYKRMPENQRRNEGYYEKRAYNDNETAFGFYVFRRDSGNSYSTPSVLLVRKIF